MKQKILFYQGKMCFRIDKKGKGFKENCSPREYDYHENEDVIFEKKSERNFKTGGTFTYAINVRPACEE